MDGSPYADTAHGRYLQTPATRARQRRTSPHGNRAAAEMRPSTDHASPRAGRRGGRSVALCATQPWRRHRRALRPRRSLSRTRRENDQLRRRGDRDEPQFAHEIQLRIHGCLLLLLLVLLALGDPLAHVARVVSIKRRLQRDRKGICVRALDDHPRPRHRLQQRPMSADAREQRENDEDSTGFAEEDGHGRVCWKFWRCAQARPHFTGSGFGAAGFFAPFGSRFTARSSAVIFDSMPPAGTSAFALHTIAFSTRRRWSSLPQPL